MDLAFFVAWPAKPKRPFNLGVVHKLRRFTIGLMKRVTPGPMDDLVYKPHVKKDDKEGLKLMILMTLFMEGPLVDIPAWSGLKICDSLDNDNVMPSYVCWQKYGSNS